MRHRCGFSSRLAWHLIETDLEMFHGFGKTPEQAEKEARKALENARFELFPNKVESNC